MKATSGGDEAFLRVPDQTYILHAVGVVLRLGVLEILGMRENVFPIRLFLIRIYLRPGTSCNGYG